MKNKVARLVEIGKLEIQTENIRKLNVGEVLVEMKAVGICGSDLHFFMHGGLGSFKEKLPMEMGHEPAGMIIDSNNSKWLKNGDRVAIEPGNPCLNCSNCKNGKHNLCDFGTFMGAAGSPGAFREYMILDEHQLVKMNDSMSFEEGALLEPLGIALHSLNQINFKINSTVAIIGAGPIGLSILNLAKINGAEKIIVVDKLEYRLNKASKIGATHIFLESNQTVEQIRDVTNGGVDFSFDAAGKQNTINLSFDLARKGGCVSLVGIPTVDFIDYNPHKSRIKELIVYNVRRSNQTLQSCHDVFAKTKLDIITHKLKIDDIQKGFELASNYQDEIIKAMIIK